VSYRILPNFNKQLVLKFNNDDDYMTILGSMRDVVKPDGYMRGLVKEDLIYEFQAAQLHDQLNEFEAAKAFCLSLKEGQDKNAYKAKAVPSLPELVNMQSIAELYGATNVAAGNLPIGIIKENLALATHSFERNKVFLGLGDDETGLISFIHGLVYTILQIKNVRITILDSEDLLSMQPAVLAEFSAINDVTVANDVVQINSEIESLVSEAPQSVQKFIVILSLRALVEGLGTELLPKFGTYITGGGLKNLCGLVVCGDPSRFSSFSYEAWFRELVSAGNGVWLGTGFDSQTLLKNSGYDSEYRKPLERGFAWLVEKGVSAKIKYILAPTIEKADY
jgi:S-DNA-T family DNA segregation ATPase FtsK/SpoIIIE